MKNIHGVFLIFCTVFLSVVCDVRSEKQDETDLLIVFIKNIKTLNIGMDTTEDVLRVVGKPNHGISEYDGHKHYGYGFNAKGDLVDGSIVFDKSDKLMGIEIHKIYNGKEIYKKGELHEKNVARAELFNTNASCPTNAVIGQVYFNSTDSHFYGYNGKEWLQLDNPKSNP